MTPPTGQTPLTAWKNLKMALALYFGAHVAEHAEDCPQDDTCDCPLIRPMTDATLALDKAFSDEDRARRATEESHRRSAAGFEEIREGETEARTAYNAEVIARLEKELYSADELPRRGRLPLWARLRMVDFVRRIANLRAELKSARAVSPELKEVARKFCDDHGLEFGDAYEKLKCDLASLLAAVHKAGMEKAAKWHEEQELELDRKGKEAETLDAVDAGLLIAGAAGAHQVSAEHFRAAAIRRAATEGG